MLSLLHITYTLPWWWFFQNHRVGGVGSFCQNVGGVELSAGGKSFKLGVEL